MDYSSGYDHAGNYYKFEQTLSSFMYGINLTPCLGFEFGKIFVKTKIKYRYLFQNVHSKIEITDQENYSEDFKRRAQSLAFILATAIKTSKFILEVGIQTENWVFKHEYNSKFWDWNKNWEVLLFLGIGKPY